MRKESFNRRRLEILNSVLSFPVLSHNWEGMAHPKVGDLVSIHSAPTSKWYMAWVDEVDSSQEHFSRYLLRSIEDNSLCWWENVGFNIWVGTIGHNWEWTDRQYEFAEKWYRAVEKVDYYPLRSTSPVFGENNDVELKIRARFDEEFDGNPETFKNWKTMKSSEMQQYIKRSIDIYRKHKELKNTK